MYYIPSDVHCPLWYFFSDSGMLLLLIITDFTFVFAFCLRYYGSTVYFQIIIMFAKCYI